MNQIKSLLLCEYVLDHRIWRKSCPCGVKVKLSYFLKRTVRTACSLVARWTVHFVDSNHIIYIYIYVRKLNQTVLELDFRAVKFLFFSRRDLNPHHHPLSLTSSALDHSTTSTPWMFYIYTIVYICNNWLCRMPIQGWFFYNRYAQCNYCKT
jgi:hypothetical protein